MGYSAGLQFRPPETTLRQHSNRALACRLPECPQVCFSKPSFNRANFFRHLAPEEGWIEHSELDFTPRWDSEETPEPSHFQRWCNDFLLGLDERGRSARIESARTRRQLEEAGFVDVEEETLRYYVSPWPRENCAKELGRWVNLWLVQGFRTWGLWPMCGDKDGDRMPVKNCHELCDLAEKEICVLRYRAYLTL